MSTLNQYFKKWVARVDGKLNELLPRENAYPSAIHRAMRYSVFSGGKRLRPVLAIASYEVCGKDPERALGAACAIELIHTWTLIHDDLPAMDNDDFRRGRYTCHRKFGEANAILAGSALLALAFRTLSRIRPYKVGLRLIDGIADAIGSVGVIGGQVVDKLYENKEVNLPALDYISIHKTGHLIKAACWTGCVIAGADKSKERHIAKYGECIGLAFQVTDDLIDGDGYRRIMGGKETRALAERLIAEAVAETENFGKRGRCLAEIAKFILERRK
ncbi:MAG: polyprenyl synthetase family protein [Candidatus Omnitrophica bacterium]|nr:polyprenyl synthetase family protein [Candidatus Omnitrophota bacterium]